MRRLLNRLIPRTTGGRWAAGVGNLVGAALVIYLTFFVFGFHLIFVDEVVDEEAPEFAGGDADIDELISEARGDDTDAATADDDERAAVDQQIAELESEIVSVRDAAMAQDTDEAMEAMYQQVDVLQAELAELEAERERLMTPAEVEQAAEAEKQITEHSMSVAEHMLDEPEMAEMADDGDVRVTAVGTFGARSHPASGVAVVLTDGTQTFLRFDDDFATDNGPDLNVYLTAAGPDASVGDLAADFVDLGDLKGNIGAQNYEIPADVDLDRYRTVAIWCVRFSVVFGTAELEPMG
ncbi:DM13 domain-containing protein [Candidatus Poriferisodalis sp.]|uniref:DM13 domain-containing protein n=1 Tax=Candidatus Poriferisodalis sp. TaxID=3101277 RepID=UPI003C6F63A0